MPRKYPEDSEKSQKKGIDGLTYKQRKFVAEYVTNGGNAYKACRVAYPNQNENSIKKESGSNMKRPAVREAIKKEIERQGLTMERIVAPVQKALHATKQQDGEIVDDLEMQLKGHDRAMNLLKFLDRENLKEQSMNINFNLWGNKVGGDFVEDVIDGESD